MANSYKKYTANGSTQTFTVTFPYINTNHVEAYVDDVEDTTFTWPTSSTITLSAMPGAGAIVLLQRVTPKDARLVDFEPGNTVSEDNLDTDSEQNFYAMQEVLDAQENLLLLDLTDDAWDSDGHQVKNVADPTEDQHAVTKKWIETINTQGAGGLYHFKFPDPTEDDQGVTGNGNTLKALVDAVAGNKATIYLRHNSDEAITTYTLTTNLTIPTNITLVIEDGALIDGAGILDIAGIFQKVRRRCFGASVTVEFTGTALQGYAFPEWWINNTVPGTTEMAVAAQKATAALEANMDGGTVLFGNGLYLHSTTVTSDRSVDQDLGRISFKGMGEYTTRIDYAGSGACFSIKGALSGAVAPWESNQRIESMTLVGPSRAVGTFGVYADNAAYVYFKRLYITNFSYGMYLESVDQSYFEHLKLRYNTKGLFAIKSTGTHPNNLVFTSCHISGNLEFGAYFKGAANICFFGGGVEHNGTTTPGWGLAIEDAGYQGEIGLSCHGVYFEGNEGQADVMILNTATDLVKNVVHSFVACGFKRTSNTHYTTNNIYTDFDDPATVGLQTVNLVGCGFNGYNTYVPDAGRPYINFLNGVTQENFKNSGSIFESTIETPETNERWKAIDIDCGTGSGSPYAISTKELPGIYQCNIDSLTASYRLDLPAASDCVGYELIVYATTTHGTYALMVQPDGTDKIIGTSAAGDYIYTQTAGAFVRLISLGVGRWGILNPGYANALPIGWTEE